MLDEFIEGYWHQSSSRKEDSPPRSRVFPRNYGIDRSTWRVKWTVGIFGVNRNYSSRVRNGDDGMKRRRKREATDGLKEGYHVPSSLEVGHHDEQHFLSPFPGFCYT